jgi:acyl-CoA dehydrogenase
MWTSNAGIADHYVVFARTGQPGTHDISAFMIDADTPGIEIVEQLDLISAHPTARVRFSCRVPTRNLVGSLHDGFKIAMRVLDIYRSTVGGAAVGIAYVALREAADWSKKRKMFGGTQADLQMTQARLADMSCRCEAATLLTLRSAWLKDMGADRVTKAASTAKLVATEAACRNVDDALQLRGGRGIIKGSRIEALYREVRASRIYEGSSEVQRLVIARQLLRE